MVKKRIFYFIFAIIFVVVICVGVLLFNNKKNISTILKKDSYAYLPNAAKEYIEDVYENTGEIVLTEKNKIDNEPYLNPEYIKYLGLSEEEKKEVELVPDTYIVDYEVSKNYSTSNLPSSYDLRNVNEKNYVTPIKNQGSTGICWAFSSIENVETLLLKQSGQSYSDNFQKFSVRQLDYITSNDHLVEDANWTECSGSCTYTSWNNLENGSRTLGDGGNFYVSSIVMANGLSLTDESVLPWTEKNDPKWAKKIIGYDKSLYEVNSTIQMAVINEDTADKEVINSYVSDVKKYMLQYGGPIVGTYSPKSTCGFTNTDGKKSMKVDDCARDSKNVDEGHAMQIIGWDDDYEYTYCDAGTKHYSINNNSCTSGTKTTGKGAWIVRNSWGESTQEANEYKYIYLTYDSTRLSIGFTKEISKMENRSWNNNYHSNPWIDRKLSNGMYSVNNQTKEFDTHNTKAEKLEKIKFLTSSKDGKYTISVITNSHTYNNIASINSNETGIYTVDLSNKDVIIDSNNFSVKIEGVNSSKFYKDTISVFTSNVNKEPLTTSEFSGSIKTYSEEEEKPSQTNPAFVKGLNYTGYMVMEHYTKNIPSNAELQYKVKLDGEDYSSYFFKNSSKITAINNHINVQLEPRDSEYSDKPVCGKKFTFEILYNGTVLDSFPLKRICTNSSGTVKYTQSNVRFHKNDGSGYYSTNSKNDLSNIQMMYSDGTGREYIGDNTKFFEYDKYIKSWNTKADGTGTSYTDNNLLVYTDMDLYAQWSDPLKEEHKYKISWQCDRYICDSTQILSKTNNVTFNKEFTIPDNTFTNLTEGQEFIHWAFYPSDKNEDIYYEEEKVTNLTENGFSLPYNLNENEWLHAVWSDSYNTVKFMANGGSGDMKSIKIIKDKPSRLKMNLFTKEGFKFKNWNTKSDGSGTSYNDKEIINVNTNIKLYAQWTEKSISIKSNKDNIDFGEAYVNFDKNIEKTLTITNNGELPVKLTINNPTTSGPFISIGFVNNKVLEPNETYTVTLAAGTGKIYSDTPGTYNGEYVITATNINETTNYELKIPATIVLKEHTISIKSNKDNIDFGEAYVNFDKNIEKTLTITNNGDLPVKLTINNPVTSGPFVSIGFVNNKELQPNQTYTVKLAAGTGRTYSDTPGTYNGNYVFTATEIGGNKTFNLTIPATIKINKLPQTVSYTTHVQTYGWQNYVKDGQMAGTTGEKKRLEGIKIKLDNQDYAGNIEYRTHIQKIGWEDTYKKNNEMSGTEGKAYRLEAIQIRLTGEMAKHYDVYYRVHAQKFGWLGWAKNGEQSGTAAYKYRLEGIEIQLVEKGGSPKENEHQNDNKPFYENLLEYTTHVQSYGWQDYVVNGQMSGTTGEKKRLEGIKINLVNQKYSGNIEYRTHIQKIGWEDDYKKNGEMSGTEGMAYRLEAIQIRLTGEIKEHYDIYYRVHAQKFGWLGWAKNGEQSGTAGYAYRLEGIEIQLVEKGQLPKENEHQNDNDAFYENK